MNKRNKELKMGIKLKKKIGGGYQSLFLRHSTSKNELKVICAEKTLIGGFF